MRFDRRGRSRKLASLLACLTLSAASQAAPAEDAASESHALKVLQLPIRTDGPKSLDPVVGSTQYDNMACVQIYETLLENSYYAPLDFEPRLLAELPTTDDGGLTWHFKLKPGVVFYDPNPNPCFGGKATRPIRTDDVFYSLKHSPTRSTNLRIGGSSTA